VAVFRNRDLYWAWSTAWPYNIFLSAFGRGTVQLGETSMTGASLAAFPARDRLAMTWQGVGNNLVNVILYDGVRFGRKITLPYRSLERPNIAESGDGRLALTWIDAASRLIQVSFSTDGLVWTAPAEIPEIASQTPAVAQFAGALHLAWVSTSGYLRVGTWNGTGVDWRALPDRSLVAPSLAIVNGRLLLSFSDPITSYVTTLDSSGDLNFTNRRTYNLQSVKTPIVVDFRLPNRVAGPKLPLYITTPLQNVTFATRF
jgi:hypothetical protein